MASSTPITEALVAEVVARVSQDMRVRRFLSGGGRIHLDRRLPFLCVYRRPPASDDPGTGQLASAEAAALHLPGDAGSILPSRLLVRGLVEALATHFGGFLLAEIWADRDRETSGDAAGDDAALVPPAPSFKVLAPKRRQPHGTVQTLLRSLSRIRLFRQQAEVQLDESASPHPPGMKPLLLPAEAARWGCYCMGLAVRPVYRDLQTGEVFPRVLRNLRRRVGYALKRAFFFFAREHTSIRPQHYYSLGRRSILKVVWEIDRRLAEIDNSFDLLLQATPVNPESAWREFQRNRFRSEPVFHYRPLTVEPGLLKRALYDLPIETIEDPTLAHLFLEKQNELDRKITMLGDVGTARFLAGSLQVYGTVTSQLLGLARQLLEATPLRRPQTKHLDAHAFAAKAEKEIELYRERHEGFAASVTVRKDIYPGLLVSQGDLFVGKGVKIPEARLGALLQHEVGTHLVTYYNGRAQPFHQLYCGLAGYDSLQEGLAVLSEYLVDGLDFRRVRTLAARVIAVQSLMEGASFTDTYRRLTEQFAFPQRQAYTVTMRVHRGGGLTKDLVYLRGLVTILDYLQQGGDIEPLVTGKLAADHIPIIQELRLRQVLIDPPLRPRYFDWPGVSDKLAELREGKSVLQLCEAQKQ
ncbi:MAG: flavohemoglobin expression-modulating QEGLA motif protein [Planctomycetota bacterium]|jgi:uncharacterized protein (TIGR02421 family)